MTELEIVLPATSAADPEPDAVVVGLLPDWKALEGYGLDRHSRAWKFTAEQDWNRLTTCIRGGCSQAFEGKRLCPNCAEQWRSAGKPDLTTWVVSDPREMTKYRREEPGLCLICCHPEHERPGIGALGLCDVHTKRFLSGRFRGLWSEVEHFVVADAGPLPTWGQCVVLVAPNKGCERLADGQTRLCNLHKVRWRSEGGAVDLAKWLKGFHPPKSWTVYMADLSDVQFRQVCWSIQRQIERNTKIVPSKIKKSVQELVDKTDGRSLALMDPSEGEAASYLRMWITLVGHGSSSPDEEVERDVIRLGVIDPAWKEKQIDLTRISQDWMRQLVRLQIRHYVARGTGMTAITDLDVVIRWWSEFLHRSDPHEGKDPTKLTRESAIIDFITWLRERITWSERYAQLQASHDPADARHSQQIAQAELIVSTSHRFPFLTMSRKTMRGKLQAMRQVFHDQHDYLSEIGATAAFQVRSEQIPRLAQPKGWHKRELEGQSHRALPRVVFEQCLAALDHLGEDGPIRNGVELLMRTGRRPLDLFSVRFDCLVWEKVTVNGQERSYPFLQYMNAVKFDGIGEPHKLPLFSAAAHVIERQQSWLRTACPHFFDDSGSPLSQDLRLFPTFTRNPDGTRSFGTNTLGGWITAWIRGSDRHHRIKRIHDLLDGDGRPFDRNRIDAYSFRHTFTQQLADQKVPVDTLRALMGHATMNTTQIYYAVSMDRRVEEIALLQKLPSFGIARESTDITIIPAHVRARLQVTDVSVSAGSCAEMGNVQHHGNACQYQHQCFSCRHFLTDASQLVELEAARLGKAQTLARKHAGTDPIIAGPLNDAEIIVLDHHVRHLDELISRCEKSIQDNLNEADQRRVRQWLDEHQRITEEVLLPLKEHTGSFQLESPTFDPTIAAEADSIVNEQKN